MRWVYVGLWAFLLIDAFVFSPAAPPEQGAWALEALTGDWEGKNPLPVAVFNLLGIWPLIFASRLRGRLNGRPVPAWPFVVGSMALGAFALLPYFILQPHAVRPQRTWRILAWIHHPIALAGIVLGFIGLGAWGLIFGDVAEFWHAFQTFQLIHIMSLDFCVLVVTLVSLELTRPRAT